MGKPGAFLDIDRNACQLRPAAERAQDFDPLYLDLTEDERRAQASRCMKCGVPFCQVGAPFGKARPSGCPLHNAIPEWNELVYRGNWRRAAARLAMTSPLPEFTSRVCPALCEASCNLGSVEGEPVTIHFIERAISDWEWANGGPAPFAAASEDAPSVAVVGSGPAGLAAAWNLAQLGARVTIVERADRAGGLLMYGIPNMKLEKSVIDRRVDLMRERGVEFMLNTDASHPKVAAKLQHDFDAVVIAAGSRVPRRTNAQDEEGTGVVLAVDYLTDATCALLDDAEVATSAAGPDVVVIGGGDTGNDCVATAVRQGARSVRQLEFMPCPPETPAPGNPWPEWRNVKKTDYGQQEAIELMGGEIREWAVDTVAVLRDKDGSVEGLRVVDVDWSQGAPTRVDATARTMPAQLVLIACGFTGPEASIFEALGGTIATQGRPLPVMAGPSHRCKGPNTSVFACGDARQGATLVVTAIADALACVDEVAELLDLR